jgi:hypothetical protein
MSEITKTIISEKILHLRGMPVMLDSELAKIYGVETKVFNQAVKRNIERFPAEFRFQITETEFENLRSQSVTSSENYGGRRYLPFVFTEQGVAMLSAILNSKTAIELSIQIMNAFVQLRKFVASNNELIQRILSVEQKQINFENKTEGKFEALFSAMEENPLLPKQGIFYDGEIFDAYLFISKIIKSSKSSIILLDNYVDESVLEQLSKSNKQVKITILTKSITKNLQLDIKKYNEQYEKIQLIPFGLSHDRFLIIDEINIYHIGASLKDLGKKWFAFSKLECESFGLMEHIETAINPT